MTIRRRTFIPFPPEGDYLVSPTGYTWNIRRINGDGSVQSITAGMREKATALAHVLLLAGGDNTDAWETVGTDECRLLRRFRPSAR